MLSIIILSLIKYLTKHHLDSFNDFVINKIPNFSQYNPQILYKELDKKVIHISMNLFIMVVMIVNLLI